MTTKLDWRTLKPGDRVRVILEVEVSELDVNYLWPKRMSSLHFSQLDAATIERIEKPLEAGDQVFRRSESSRIPFTIMGINGLDAWIRAPHAPDQIIPLDRLERAQ